MRLFKKYLIIFFSTLGLLAAPCVLNAWFLLSAGEFCPPAKIAAFQTSGSLKLAGCATHDLTSPYKLEFYKLKKPDVIALGSSRVGSFRENYFNTKFLNMSRAMNSIDQGSFLVDQMLEIHTPKVIILGLDFWWFIGPVQKNLNHYKPPRDVTSPSVQLLLKPFVWLFDKKITWRYYWDTILNSVDTQHIGISAQTNGDGFGPDGSYYQTSILTGLQPSEDIQFTGTFRQVREGRGLFPHNQKIEPIYVDRLLKILEKFEKAGIKTYLFIPPLAPGVAKLMEAHPVEFQYINVLVETLTAKGLKIYNFHNSAGLRTSDCEFIDGYHGGDVIYLKMLANMAQAEKGPLAEYVVGIDQIPRDLALLPNVAVTSLPEVDFLHIGCSKNRS